VSAEQEWTTESQEQSVPGRILKGPSLLLRIKHLLFRTEGAGFGFGTPSLDLQSLGASKDFQQSHFSQH
jgi:hypothetical protein